MSNLDYRKNKFVLTIEVYYDDTFHKPENSGHFINVILRHFDDKLKCSVNASTVFVGRYIHDLIACFLDLERYTDRAGLIYYNPDSLEHIELLMNKFKHCKISTGCVLSGTIYDVVYDVFDDIVNDVRCKVASVDLKFNRFEDL